MQANINDIVNIEEWQKENLYIVLGNTNFIYL